MSDTVKKLRESYKEWLIWRQKRYDELVAMRGGNVHPVWEAHKDIIKTLDEEQSGFTEVIGYEIQE